MLRVIELQCHVHILAKHVPGWRTAASSLGINTKHVTGYSTAASFVGLARTIFIRCICGIFCREATKYTVIYGVYKRFWPTLVICMAKHSMRSVLLHLYTWHVRSVLLHTLYLTRERGTPLPDPGHGSHVRSVASHGAQLRPSNLHICTKVIRAQLQCSVHHKCAASTLHTI